MEKKEKGHCAFKYIWKRAVFLSTSQKLPQYTAIKQNAYLYTLLSRITLLRTGDSKEANMCKVYIVDLIQRKGAVPACENNIEFKKFEHVLK